MPFNQSQPDDVDPPSPATASADQLFRPGEVWAAGVLPRFSARLGLPVDVIGGLFSPELRPNRFALGVGLSDSEIQHVAERFDVPVEHVRQGQLDRLDRGPCYWSQLSRGSYPLGEWTPNWWTGPVDPFTYAACVSCHREQAQPTVEHLHHLTTTVACPQHNEPLVDRCLCGTAVGDWGGRVPTPGVCAACGTRIADLPTLPLCADDHLAYAQMAYAVAVHAHATDDWAGWLPAHHWFAAVHTMIVLAAWLYEPGDMVSWTPWLADSFEMHCADRETNPPVTYADVADVVLRRERVAPVLAEAVTIVEAANRLWPELTSVLVERCAQRVESHPEQAHLEQEILRRAPKPIRTLWRQSRRWEPLWQPGWQNHAGLDEDGQS